MVPAHRLDGFHAFEAILDLLMPTSSSTSGVGGGGGGKERKKMKRRALSAVAWAGDVAVGIVMGAGVLGAVWGGG